MIQNMTTMNETPEIDPLTPETFSFFDNIEGLNYSTDIVNVYMNERALQAFQLNLDAIAEAEDGADLSDLMQRDADLREEILASRHVFYLRGVADDDVSDAKPIADQHFEKKMRQVKAADGTLIKRLPEAENANYTRYFNALVLSLHIERIEDPKGRVMLDPNVDEIAHVMDKAPTLEKKRLADRIGALRISSKAFEDRIDSDFLAKP